MREKKPSNAKLQHAEALHAKECGSRQHSLLIDADVSEHSLEHKNGLRLFKNSIQDIVILRATFRFRDCFTKEPCIVLPALLGYMRQPRGKPMPDALWSALRRCVVESDKNERLPDPITKKP